MREIKAVLFDFGGTLDGDGVDWFSRLHRAIEERVGVIDEEEFRVYADRAAQAISVLADTSRLTLEQTARRLCEQILEQLAGGTDRKLAAWDAQEVAAEFAVGAGQNIDRNRAVLARLRERFRLGCISNNWGNTAGWCADYELDGYFETVIDSTVVGSSKPERLIFQAALDELGLPGGACVYVGDTYSCDVLGARGAGMGAIWITDGRVRIDQERDSAVRRIGKLEDLLVGDLGLCGAQGG